MENLPLLLLIGSILLICIRYIEESDHVFLISLTLILMSLSLVALLFYKINEIKILGIGSSFLKLSSVFVFIIHLIRSRKEQKEKRVYTTMLITSILFFMKSLFNLMHWPGVSLLHYLLFISFIPALIISFKSSQVPENKPFNIVVIWTSLSVIAWIYNLF